MATQTIGPLRVHDLGHAALVRLMHRNAWSEATAVSVALQIADLVNERLLEGYELLFRQDGSVEGVTIDVVPSTNEER